MHNKKLSPIVLILCCIGVICSAILLFLRIFPELKSDKVSFAIPYFSVQTLSEESGKSETEWLSNLYNAGVRHLIVTDDDKEAEKIAKQIGFKIARSSGVAVKGDSFVSPTLEEDNAIANKQYSGDKSVPVAVVENPFRTDVIMPDDLDVDEFEFPTVKTMYMYNAYSYHYEYNEPATENENILFRGITERGMRLIILTPLVNEQKQIVTDINAYSDIISGLEERLAPRGIKVSDEFSTLDAPKFNPYLFAGALLLAVAAVIYFISFFVKLTFKTEITLASLGVIASFGGTFVLPSFMQTYSAFGAALLFGLFETLLLYRISEKNLFEGKHIVIRFLLSLVLTLVIALTGGLYVSALLASRSYMLGFSIFAGVKAAQLVPVGFTAVFFAYILFNKKARQDKERNNKLPTLFLVAVGVMVVAALAVFVLRSGDNMLPVSSLEVNMRNWLEYTLYARPRTKEMLVAFPSLALFVVAAQKRYPILKLPISVLSSLGCVSVINTFCHIFTPVHVSVIRTLLGVLIGSVLGIIAMYIFSLILGKQKEN